MMDAGINCCVDNVIKIRMFIRTVYWMMLLFKIGIK